MGMVHVPPGIELDKAPQYLLYLDSLFGDVFGRASVAALSFISGFLLSQSYEEKNWLKIINKKFISLIIPMAFWNLVVILLGLTIFMVTNVEPSVVTGLKELKADEIIMSRILSIDYGSATQSLNFLRDIFVCFVIAPVIIALARRLSWSLILLLIAFDFYISFQPLVMRGMILVFFSLGIVYGMKFQNFSFLNRFFAPATIALLVIMFFEIYFEKHQLSYTQGYAYEIFKRLTCGAFAILFSTLLAKRYKGYFINQIDKCIYFFYLSITTVWLFVGCLCVSIIRMLPKSVQTMVSGKVYLQ